MRHNKARTEEVQLAPAFALGNGNAAPQVLRWPPVSYDGHISSLACLVATSQLHCCNYRSTATTREERGEERGEEREREAKCSGSSSGELSEGSLSPSFD